MNLLSVYNLGLLNTVESFSSVGTNVGAWQNFLLVCQDIITGVASLVHYMFNTTHIFVTSLWGCKFVGKSDLQNQQTLHDPQQTMMIPKYLMVQLSFFFMKIQV